MVSLAVWSWVPYFLNLMVLILGIFLILLVLIQRGKGGGLAGAFGGAGGSSAFGSRAGDLFTKITIVVASVWILLTMAQVMAVQDYVKDSGKQNFFPVGGGETSPSQPSEPPN